MAAKDSTSGADAIQTCLNGLTDWRGDLIREFRALIGETVSDLTADWKRNTPVWASKGDVVAAVALNQKPAKKK